MAKRPHLDWTEQEMAGLAEAALLSRLREAREAEARADAPGMGRAVKARHLWRKNRQLVEEELHKRGLL